VGAVFPSEGPPLSNDAAEALRRIVRRAAPIVARLSEIEKLRHQNRELTALLQMRTHLQYNIAHELRTPMAAIRGYARMIVDGRAGEINQTQRDYLTVITENTNRLIDIVSWMSRVAEKTGETFKLDSFDFRSAWSDSVARQEESLKAKGVRMQAAIPEESFEMIGNRDQLVQAVESLIAVAAAYARENGTIAAELSHGREHDIVVKISDNGEGLPPEALARLTERQPRQAGSVSSAAAPGLSQLHDVIGMHGGRVFVSSKAGQGSTYIFTLPAVSYGGEGN
jgi:signal transduction histidine kinase